MRSNTYTSFLVSRLSALVAVVLLLSVSPVAYATSTCSSTVAKCDLTPPTTINEGQSITLTWDEPAGSTNNLSPGPGAVAPCGSLVVTPTTTTWYTLTTLYNGSTVICNNKFTVNPAPAPPSVTITLTPDTLNAGQSSTLSWSTTNNPQWLYINNVGYISTSTSSGSFSVAPSQTTNYNATVADASGNQYNFPATLTVNQPPMCTLSVAPSNISKGSSATLTYSSQNVTSFSISPSIGTVTLNSTSTVLVSPSMTTTYTGSVSGPGGTASCTIPMGSTATLAVSCTPATTYSCSGQTIVQSVTGTSCAVTTTNLSTCVSPAFCSAGSATCLYPAPTVVNALSVIPNLLQRNRTVTVTWNIANVQSCTVIGSNKDGTSASTDTNSPGIWNTLSGSVTSSPITQQTTYTLSCVQDDPSQPPFVETVSVNVAPWWQEF
jgi:hypothetical protein